MSQLKVRRTSMRVTAENIVLNSGEWFTQNELNSIATCQQFELDEWELSGKIFSIHHDGTDYYPTYALDSKDYRPLDAMAKVILDYHRDSASFSNRCGIGAVRIPALAKSVTIHSRLNR